MVIFELEFDYVNIFLSDEDMDIKALLTAWLAKQTDEVKGKLTSWIDDVFHKYARIVSENILVY